jgi:hypothetical protein
VTIGVAPLVRGAGSGPARAPSGAATKGEASSAAVFESDFADTAAMAVARASQQGQRVAADVAQHVTGGAVVILQPVRDGFCG